MTISNKNCIYTLPNELPNDRKLFKSKDKNPHNYNLVSRRPLKTKILIVVLKIYEKLGI